MRIRRNDFREVPILFSNSDHTCQALRIVPAGSTVLSAVEALALRMMAF